MANVIVFKNDDGIVAVIHPTASGLAKLGINGIAAKDVPTGKPYKIMDTADLPADRSLRNAWTIDDAELTDGVGA